MANEKDKYESFDNDSEKRTRRSNRVGKKLPGLKKQQRKQRRRTYLPTVLLFLVVGLISLYLISPFSKVSKITVNEDQNLQKTNSQIELPFKVGDSIPVLLTHLKQEKDFMIDENAPLQSVSLHFDFPNRITINMTGVTNPAYVLKNGQYFSISNNGRISNKPVNVTDHDGICVISGFNNRNQIKYLLSQYKKIPIPIMNNINVIENAQTNEDNQRIRIIMANGNQVLAKTSTLAKKISYYPSIAKTLKKPTVIDMEVGAYSYPLKK